MKMNVKLLRRVARIILRRYKQLDMGYFLEPKKGAGPCGTTACIAGWAFVLTTPKTRNMPLKAGRMLNKNFDKKTEHYSLGMGLNAHEIQRLRDEATVRLGLDEEQRQRLFYSDRWPEPFQTKIRIDYDPGTKRYAQVVVDRIEHFIKSDGAS